MIQLNNSGVYKVTCLKDGKFYIGSSVNIKGRFRYHKASLSLGCHKNRHLQKAWNIYGENNFRFEIIEYLPDKKKTKEREQYWIDKTRCFDRKIGFNICPKVGSSFGVKRTEKFKNKIRLANLNRSPELKQKIIDAIRRANSIPCRNKGKTYEEIYGVKKAIRIKRKKREAMKGKSLWNGARILSPQHLENIRKSNSKPKSQETKDKLAKYFARTHYLINPKGDKIIIVNLTKYCRENNLNQGNMCAVSRGDYKNYKGWTKWQMDFIEPEEREKIQH